MTTNDIIKYIRQGFADVKGCSTYASFLINWSGSHHRIGFAYVLQVIDSEDYKVLHSELASIYDEEIRRFT